MERVLECLRASCVKPSSSSSSSSIALLVALGTGVVELVVDLGLASLASVGLMSEDHPSLGLAHKLVT